MVLKRLVVENFRAIRERVELDLSKQNKRGVVLSGLPCFCSSDKI
jgi:hypothetical protein